MAKRGAGFGVEATRTDGVMERAVGEWLMGDREWSFVVARRVRLTDEMDLVQVKEVCHSIIFSQG